MCPGIPVTGFFMPVNSGCGRKIQGSICTYQVGIVRAFVIPSVGQRFPSQSVYVAFHGTIPQGVVKELILISMVFRIRNVLIRIRIRGTFFLTVDIAFHNNNSEVVKGAPFEQCSGSVTFWYGFGSADPYTSGLRIRILLFSSVAFKMPTKKRFFFSLITYRRYICVSLKRYLVI